MFPAYGVKCLSRKAVHKDVRKSQIMKRRLRRHSKDFCAAGFDALVKRCWWRISREIKDLSRCEYHVFYVLYLFVTYLLTLPRTTTTTTTTNNNNNNNTDSNGSVMLEIHVTGRRAL
jgi:hypothetical protein